MRTIPYSSLERGLLAIAGIDPSNVLAHEKILISEYLTDAVKYTYDYYPWAELTVTEKRLIRQEFDPQLEYQEGDEVYHNGKYWRLYDVTARFVTDENGDPSTLGWYEIGDYYADPEWSENGTYSKGARFVHKGKTYICIKDWDYTSDSDMRMVNFYYDGVTPDNTEYYKVIDPLMERYIPYKEENEHTIGTILSVYHEDPRYNDIHPLNWREGREGIYVEGDASKQNYWWIKYRIQSPVFDETSTTDPVAQFLAPAIKAYAYKSWLIGEGQHEKAQLQDITTMDLLVREVDKLNAQQDRNLPFSIPSEPYRRLNARKNFTAEETKREIGYFRDGYPETDITINTVPNGFQAVRRGTSDQDIDFEVEAWGYKPRIIEAEVDAQPFSFGLSARLVNVLKKSNASSVITVSSTASPVIRTFEFGATSILFDVQQNAQGFTPVKQSGASTSLQFSGASEGITLVLKGSAYTSVSVTAISSAFNQVVKGPATTGIDITASGNGFTPVVKAYGTVNFELNSQSSFQRTRTTPAVTAFKIESIQENPVAGYMFGIDTYNEFGYGDYSGSNASEFIDTPDDENIRFPLVKKGITGDRYSAWLMNDGTVMTAGRSMHGEHGRGAYATGTQLDTYLPVVSENWSSSFNVYYDRDGDGTYDLGAAGETTPFNKKINDVKDIISRDTGIYYLKNNGTAYYTGYNDNGKQGVSAGLGGRVEKPTSIDIIDDAGVAMTPLTNIKQISASKYHTLFLLNDGTVWSVGSGQYKQLGNGAGTAYQLTRVKADANNILTDIVHVSAGSWHSLFVKANGDVLSCGYNNVGQLGYGPTGFTPTYPSPVLEADQTTPLTDVKFACAGSNFSMFIKNDGTVFSCGENEANQMMPYGGNYRISDNGLSAYNFKLVQAWNNITGLPITGCERLVTSNDDNLDAGSQRVYWFLDDDTVMISGYTGKSDGIIDGIRYVVTESEDGEKAKGIKEVDFSFRIAMFAKGEEFPNKIPAPPLEPSWVTTGTAAGGEVVAVEQGATAVPLTSVQQDSTVTYSISGTDAGAFNVNTTTGEITFKTAPSEVSTYSLSLDALSSSGSTGSLAIFVLVKGSVQIETWGESIFLSGFSTGTSSHSGGSYSWGIGHQHKAFVTWTGQVRTGGDNTYGQCGTGNTQSSSVAQIRVDAETYLKGAVEVALGENHTLVRMVDGTVLACGRNNHGQCGNGTNTDTLFATPVIDDEGNPVTNVIQVAAGGNHSAILHADGVVRTFGRNTEGQLGINSTTDSNVAVRILNSVSQSFTTPMSYIDCGVNHTGMITTTNGYPYTCGTNDYGELGHRNRTQSNYPKIMRDSNNIGVGSATKISCGGNHTMVIKDDTSLWGCGKNNKGQICNTFYSADQIWLTPAVGEQAGTGSSNTISDVIDVSAGKDHTIFLKTGGVVWAAGDRTYGQTDRTTNSDSFGFGREPLKVPHQFGSSYGDINVAVEASAYGNRSAVRQLL